MAITVEVAESNGAGETVTDGITTGHYGIVDTPNIAAATTSPIPANENSYEKWQRLHWASGTGSSVQNVKHWRSAGSPGTGNTHVSNLSTGTPANATYATPTRSTSTVATIAMPTSEPGSENVNSSGMTSSGSYSGYVSKQVQLSAAAVEGATGAQETWEWEEIA